MTTPAPVGWCPGALRPMASGDGLLVRLKPSGGCVTMTAAEAIADTARRFGNGRLELTTRANLQIRGVTEASHAPLLAALRHHALLDKDPSVEANRNIVVSPLAGIDPEACDVRPFVANLERLIASDARFRRLHPKWNFVVDGGGVLPLAGVPADVTFRFDPEGSLHLRFDGLDGEAMVEPGAALAIIGRLAERAAAGPVPLRMQDFVAEQGAALVAWLGIALRPRPDERSRRVLLDHLLGAHDHFVGVAPAFGQMTADDLEALCATARAFDAREIRLTPWRALLVPKPEGSASLAAALARDDLILDAADPRLRVSACVGAPACHRASTTTRSDAARLAGRVAATVHVAGCAKRCGEPASVQWRLVAHKGRYDVFDRDDLGVPRVTGLSFHDAATWLSRFGDARTA